VIWLLRVIALAIGTTIVIAIPISAVRTFVLPRGVSDQIARVVFRSMGWLFRRFARPSRSYADRDRVMALYAPVTLLLLPVVWLACVLVGYALIFWGLGVRPLGLAFKFSGSSLLTLGFATVDQGWAVLLAFTEATMGLILVALLIAYLPTFYGAWQRREAGVALIEVRAGSPPSPIEMLMRAQRLERLELLDEVWSAWEAWFHDLGESHTSLAALAFFRSSHPDQSWVNTCGTVLDAAALTASTVDRPRDVNAQLCLRAGYLALRRIADFFRIPYNANPEPDDAIALPRATFEAAYDALAVAGVPVLADRDQAWRDFAGWRVNYDAALTALADLTMAPPAPWLPDRPAPR